MYAPDMTEPVRSYHGNLPLFSPKSLSANDAVQHIDHVPAKSPSPKAEGSLVYAPSMKGPIGSFHKDLPLFRSSSWNQQSAASPSTGLEGRANSSLLPSVSSTSSGVVRLPSNNLCLCTPESKCWACTNAVGTTRSNKAPPVTSQEMPSHTELEAASNTETKRIETIRNLEMKNPSQMLRSSDGSRRAEGDVEHKSPVAAVYSASVRRSSHFLAELV